VRIIKEVQRRRHGDFPAWLKEHTPLSYKERRFGDPEKHAAAVLGAYVDGVVAAPSAAGKLRKLIKRHQVRHAADTSHDRWDIAAASHRIALLSSHVSSGLWAR
jgi:hypothetical protein